MLAKRNKNMLIGGLQATTLLDYPGKVACTIFTKGCNFRCHYCHNPELVLPELIAKTDTISEEDFFDFLNKRKNFLDAVCITGGEPTLHNDLKDFIKKIKNLGFLVKLDSNGSNPEILKELIKENLIDYIAMDIKACPRNYQKIVNVDIDPEKIKASIEIIKNSGLDYEFRTTVLGTLLSKEEILEIAEFLSPAKAYYLQHANTSIPLVNPEFEEKLNTMSRDELAQIVEDIKDKFELCKLR